MKVLFDTSVLVPALVDQLSTHPASFDTFITYTSNDHQGVISAHCLAECFSVLTALPLPRRITAPEAHRLIEESILGRLEVIPLEVDDYREAITMVAARGLSSGIIYDALHVRAAIKASCERIYTKNLDHFRPLCPRHIVLSAP